MTFSKSGICLEQAKKLHADEMNERVQCDFPLDAASVVFDVGAYDGDWTARLIRWHGFAPVMFLYEPVPALCQKAAARFAGNSCISTFNFGLSLRNEDALLHTDPDDPYATGEYVASGEGTTVRFKDVAEVTKTFSAIDLMALNIEGGEYKVLSRLIDSGEILKVKNLLVQFHNVIPNADAWRASLCVKLGHTHSKLFTYPFAWDSWSRR